jgi:hypothetical protein
MAQIARPISDVSVGSWDDAGSAEVDGSLWNSVDEVSSDDDASYIFETGTETTCEVKLDSLIDPESAAGHVLHVLFRSIGSGGPEKLDIFLVEGSTVRVTLGNQVNRSGSYADVNYTLSADEANSIAAYNDLRVRFTTDTLGGGESMRVTQAYFEVPDAASPQTVNPDAIASAETFGTVRIDLETIPGAIPTAETFGATQVNLETIPTAITTEEVFGLAVIMVDQTIEPNAIASGEIIGGVSVNLNVDPDAILSAEDVSGPRVDLQAVAAGIISAETFGALYIDLEALPDSIPSAEIFGTVAISAGGGPQTIDPDAILTGELFGNPELLLQIHPDAIGSGETFGNPFVELNAIPNSIASGETFGVVNVTIATEQIVQPVAIESLESFGTMRVKKKNKSKNGKYSGFRSRHPVLRIF